jgi:hypothetical protein
MIMKVKVDVWILMLIVIPTHVRYMLYVTPRSKPRFSIGLSDCAGAGHVTRLTICLCLSHVSVFTTCARSSRCSRTLAAASNRSVETTGVSKSSFEEMSLTCGVGCGVRGVGCGEWGAVGGGAGRSRRFVLTAAP